MSELKEHLFVPYSELREGDELTDAFTIAKSYYLKSEADKVIAEKDSEIARLNAIRKVHVEAIESMEAGLLQDDKEIRHQKYKRCLAMSKWCFTKSNYHFVLARHGEDAKKNNRKSILYSKWHRRWLAIADKFKEAK